MTDFRFQHPNAPVLEYPLADRVCFYALSVLGVIAVLVSII